MIPFSNRLPEGDRRIYQIDVLAGAYFGLHLGFLVPFIPVLLKRIGASPFQVGLSIAAPFLGLVLVFPLLKFLPPSTKALDLITIPCFFSRLSIGFLGFVTGPWPILSIYLIDQFIEAIGFSAYSKLLKYMYSEDSRPLAMGYVRAFVVLFQIFGSVLGGFVLDAGGADLIFLLSGICGAVSALSFRRIFTEKNSPLFSTRKMGFKDIVRTNRQSRLFFWFNVTVMAYGFGNLLIIGVLPTMLIERFNISNAALGSLTGVTNIVLILSYLLIGEFIRRFGAQTGFFLAMTAGLFNAWLFLFASKVSFLIFPFALNGIMFAGFDVCWSILILKYAPEEEISIYASVYTLLMGIRGIVATMVSNLALPLIGTNFFLFAGGVFTFLGLLIGFSRRSRWIPPHD